MIESFGNRTWKDHWHALSREIGLSFQEWLGTPARLMVWAEQFPPTDVPPIGSAAGGIDETRVAPWHRFGQWSAFDFPRREDGLLMGWTRDSFGSYSGCRRICQPLSNLASTTKRRVAVDIRNIDGLGCSKGPLHKYDCLADFARHECGRELGAADEATLYSALAHREIRIIHQEKPSDHLSFYAWDNRVFLSNAGGSHHFAAAQYLAVIFDRPIVIEATLHETILSEPAIESLRSEFNVFAVHDKAQSECAFMDAMKPSDIPFYWMPLPTRLGQARAIFLPRSDQRASRVAAVLRQSGFTDLGVLLLDIAQKQRTPDDRITELEHISTSGRINEKLRGQIAERLTAA
ncbi:DUF6685 family protein [Salinisphaera orenii]|uniref:DUF6685 family protein n=1 Tax=Salinisphaera orenii TaxID=856731 RepID=UPI00195513B5